MLRNINFYDKYIHIRKHKKRYSYNLAMRALLEGRDNNPAHEEFFNSLNSGLKKKNQCWDRTSVDGRGSIVRTLYRIIRMENMIDSVDFYEKHLLLYT